MLSTALTAVSDRQERVHPLRESIRRSMRCDAMLRRNVRRGHTSAVMVTDALVGGLDFWSDRITWPHSGTLAGTHEGRRSTTRRETERHPQHPPWPRARTCAEHDARQGGRAEWPCLLFCDSAAAVRDRIGSDRARTDWPRKETAGLSVCSRTGYRFELCE